MKTRYKKLMTLLADKTLSFGCQLKLRKEGRYYDPWESVLSKYNPLVIKGYEKGFVQVGSANLYHCEYIDVTKGIENLFKILGHPVGLARVLAKMDLLPGKYKTNNFGQQDMLFLCQLWRDFGFERTLDGVEWEEVCKYCKKNWDDIGACECHTGAFEAREPEFIHIPTQKEATALLGFLFGIFSL